MSKVAISSQQSTQYKRWKTQNIMFKSFGEKSYLFFKHGTTYLQNLLFFLKFDFVLKQFFCWNLFGAVFEILVCVFGHDYDYASQLTLFETVVNLLCTFASFL